MHKGAVQNALFLGFWVIYLAKLIEETQDFLRFEGLPDGTETVDCYVGEKLRVLLATDGKDEHFLGMEFGEFFWGVEFKVF